MIMTNHDPRACTARSSCDERLGRADVHKERIPCRRKMCGFVLECLSFLGMFLISIWQPQPHWADLH